MKNILKFALPIVFILFHTSCSKDKVESLYNEVNVTLKNSESYTFDLEIAGDEEGAIIKTQATNFQNSELVRDITTEWSLVYKYEPLPGYVGTDFTVIETCTGGEFNECQTKNLIRINFNITE
ncbi:hypothetical protein [Aquimarina brevivitae]|uniref:Lipoprotein n=1 Tax=Aquimarina brevivitae TaxID=323412 RepID=A0A4Q7NYE9_9FLAO|nr:hypothetical protein [Aquimarina brevivitae]RZS92267.1 hypothetical protein EV197_2903 [Aquimarina brevivitae]